MSLGFPGAQMVKNLPAMQETQVWSLGWEDPLEKAMDTHSKILALRIPWTEEPGVLQSMAHKETDITERLSLSQNSERGPWEWNQIARTTRSFNSISQPLSSFCLLCCSGFLLPPSTHDTGDAVYFLVRWGVSSPPLAHPSGKPITSDRLVWNYRSPALSLQGGQTLRCHLCSRAQDESGTSHLLGSFSSLGFPGGSDSKESACSVGDLSSIPGSGRSPGGGNGNPLQYSCLENSMDRGAWIVPQSQAQLSDWQSHSLPSSYDILNSLTSFSWETLSLQVFPCKTHTCGSKLCLMITAVKCPWPPRENQSLLALGQCWLLQQLQSFAFKQLNKSVSCLSDWSMSTLKAGVWFY